MKPLLITSGEPAGIGPDVCLSLGAYDEPVVIAGDKAMLAARTKLLGLGLTFDDYHPHQPIQCSPGHVSVLHIQAPVSVIPGKLEVQNASYVIDMLNRGIDGCLSGEFSGMVTAPVQKSIINAAGIPFKGHTELLATRCGKEVVMMLASKKMRVALVTTHIPLKQVSEAITQDKLTQVIKTVHHALKHDFGIESPLIYVSGLNPHAGEGGYLGQEEVEVIRPVIDRLSHQGMNIQGPYSADTMFCQDIESTPDAYIAMYHDQGLPVLKYASFGQAINVTLGLSIIRTSVDHGTALSLAGTGHANPKSLHEAVKIAKFMAQHRHRHA